MTNSGAIKAVLGEYSNEQVSEAVRALCRHVRADGSVRSPFGLLYRAACDSNEDFFPSRSQQADVKVDVITPDALDLSEMPPLSPEEVQANLVKLSSMIAR